jgi:hypothetical protein
MWSAGLKRLAATRVVTKVLAPWSFSAAVIPHRSADFSHVRQSFEYERVLNSTCILTLVRHIWEQCLSVHSERLFRADVVRYATCAWRDCVVSWCLSGVRATRDAFVSDNAGRSSSHISSGSSRWCTIGCTTRGHRAWCRRR